MKEISSDGDVSTIDVIYPASPFFLAVQAPETLRRMMLPLLVYANNNTTQYGRDIPYTLKWAPHHLGHWPICDLPQYKQEQMPMEETGNLLLMITGIAYKQGWNEESISYLDDYWSLLNMYADYLSSTLPGFFYLFVFLFYLFISIYFFHLFYTHIFIFYYIKMIIIAPYITFIHMYICNVHLFC